VIFTVTWEESAEDELAQLWADALDKRALTRAADRVEVDLRRDGHLLGESRPDGRRIHFEPPLGILFEVREPDRLIIVLSVWQVPAHD
jgi:hypothetical protein